MAVIWQQSNNVEIKSTEGCRVEIRSTEDCRSTEPLKNRGTPWKYDLKKAVDIRDQSNMEEHRGSTI